MFTYQQLVELLRLVAKKSEKSTTCLNPSPRKTRRPSRSISKSLPGTYCQVLWRSSGKQSWTFCVVQALERAMRRVIERQLIFNHLSKNTRILPRCFNLSSSAVRFISSSLWTDLESCFDRDVKGGTVGWNQRALFFLNVVVEHLAGDLSSYLSRHCFFADNSQLLIVFWHFTRETHTAELFAWNGPLRKQLKSLNWRHKQRFTTREIKPRCSVCSCHSYSCITRQGGTHSVCVVLSLTTSGFFLVEYIDTHALRVKLVLPLPLSVLIWHLVGVKGCRWLSRRRLCHSRNRRRSNFFSQCLFTQNSAFENAQQCAPRLETT